MRLRYFIYLKNVLFDLIYDTLWFPIYKLEPKLY